MSIKFLLFFGGGVFLVLGGGGRKCRFYFYGREDFSELLRADQNSIQNVLVNFQAKTPWANSVCVTVLVSRPGCFRCPCFQLCQGASTCAPELAFCFMGPWTFAWSCCPQLAQKRDAQHKFLQHKAHAEILAGWGSRWESEVGGRQCQGLQRSAFLKLCRTDHPCPRLGSVFGSKAASLSDGPSTTTTIFELISRAPIFHLWGIPGCHIKYPFYRVEHRENTKIFI